MIRLWHRLADRLAHREPATPLALFRIALGLSILYTLLPMIAADVVAMVWMDRPYGGYRDLEPDSWLVAALGGPTDAAVTILVGLGVVSALLLLIGLGSRVTPLVANQVMIALFALNPESGGGHDRLLTAGLWLLVLAPSTATLSLDARLFGPDKRFVSSQPVAAWPRYLVIFQLVVVYFTTGVQKLGQDWMPWGGWSALYYALLAPSWQRYDTTWVAAIYPLTQLATAMTWLWEVGAPLWLLAFWYRATRDRPGRLRALSNRLDLRAVMAAIGLFFHACLWFTMNLGPFSLVTSSFYLCLWHHDEYAAAWRRLRDKLFRTDSVRT